MSVAAEKKEVLNSNPILSQSKLAIKLHRQGFVKYFCSFSFEWSSSSVRLTANRGSKLCLLWTQGLGIFLYGICCTLFGIFVESEKITIANRFISFMCLSASIAAAGVIPRVESNGNEMATGINGLLDIQIHFARKFENEWNQLKTKTRRLFRTIGVGINMAMQGSIYAAYVAPPVAVVLGLDPLYYFLDHFFVKSFLRHLVNWVGAFCFVHSVCRIYTYVVMYGVISLQAYFCCFKILTLCGNTNRQELLGAYHQLQICHNGVSSFTSTMLAIIMFLGHTTTIACFWVNLRAWEEVHPLLNVVFFFSGIYLTAGIPLTLATVSGISDISSTILEYVFKPALIEGNQKILKSSVGLYKRQIQVLRPILFQSGNWFVITREAPMQFLDTMLNNLTSAILTF